MSKRNWKKTFFRGKAYVNIGHGSWLGFLVSIGTLTIVFYDYGITNIPIFKLLFENNPLRFLVMAITTYILIAGCIGFWAYKSEGAEPTSAELAWGRNPAYQKIIGLLEEILNKYENLIMVLENNKLETTISSIEDHKNTETVE